MFTRFSAGGFSGETFYADDDRTSFRRIREELRKMDSNRPVGDFLLKMLTVIAPGGHGLAEERRKLRSFLTVQAGPSNAAKLTAIEAHIAAWATSSDMDPGPTLRAIFAELAYYDGGWVGTSQNFPNDGFFTGADFPLSAAETHCRAAGLM